MFWQVIMKQAGEQLKFKTIQKIGTDNNWQGTVNCSGTLRLTAVGAAGVHVIAWHIDSQK